MNIVLTGFMASGKTTVAKILGGLCGFEVIDTDKYIEDGEGMTVNAIFDKYGELYFRTLERAAIEKVSKLDNKIIATGGGAVTDPDNISRLRENGIIFNLSPDFEVIEKRIEEAAKTRPLMRGQSIDKIRERFISRQKFYDDCDYKINIGADDVPERTAMIIMEKFKQKVNF